MEKWRCHRAARARDMVERKRRISENARYDPAGENPSDARTIFATTRCARWARPLERHQAVARTRAVPSRPSDSANVSRPLQRAAGRKNGGRKRLAERA